MENIISHKVVRALNLQMVKRPKPYKISWVKKGVDMQVTETCNLTFSIRKNFINDAICNVVDMDVCYIILGRPWKYDIRAVYDGRVNSYSFRWKGKNIKLLTSSTHPATNTKLDLGNSTTVSKAGILATYKEVRCLFVVVIREE